jgi:hypothetical protein
MQKPALFAAALALLLPAGQAHARKEPPVNTYETPTTWAPLAKSMTDLLNEGWVITGFNNYQTEMFNNNISSYSFILANRNKYVLCFLENPAMNDATSKCRALN